MGKHKHSEKHNEFQELVSSIRAAEEHADQVKSDYDAKAAELLKHGREKSAEMRENYEKKAADSKNKILSSERHKTEKMSDEIIADAKKAASSLRSRKLDKKGLNAVFDNFVSSL